MIGERIAHYQVIEKLGQGGMGEVYLAEDILLERKVALKFLPLSLQEDKIADKRFLREAKSAAAIEHPYICNIKGVGETDDGQDFIVMEYVEGQTLKERIEKGPLPLPETLKIGAEMAEALEAAHAAGIVHRDLKPTNIMITPSGHAKVMDFGLAKKVVRDESAAGEDITAALTREGTTLGTLAYMSPEQLRGKDIDFRSDIFSFGIVLYEMLTGVHPFRRPDAAETSAAILREDPAPLATYLEEIPELLQHTVRKMLAKSAEDRYQSVHEIRTNLEEIRENTGPQTAALNGQRFSRKGLWLGLSLALMISGAVLLAALFGWLSISSSSVPATPAIEAVPLTSFPGGEWRADFSPQGDKIAFQWNGDDQENPNFDIYVKQIGPGAPLRLTTYPGFDRYSRWSPDGQEIAFARWFPDHILILAIPTLGGPERTLATVGLNERWDLGLSGLSWAPDGKSLLVTFRPEEEVESSIFLLNLDSGEMEQVTFPPEGIFGDYYGEISPDGSTIGFFRRYSWHGYDLYTQRLGEEEPRRITSEDFQTARGLCWMPNGEELVFSAGRFRTPRLWRVDITRGEVVPLVGEENLQRLFPTVSGQGDLLAYTERTPTQGDIWRFANPRMNATEKAPEPLISSSRDEMYASLSRDGETIALTSNRSGQYEIWVGRSDGSQLRQLTRVNGAGSPEISPDGKLVSFDLHQEGGADIYVVSMQGGSPRQLTQHPADDVVPRWSRDGRWIYFGSNRTGKHEVWKIPFEGGEAVQVTQQGGYSGRESSDGYLYYTKGIEGEIWKIPVTGGEEVPVYEKELSYDRWDIGSEGLYLSTWRTKGEGKYEWTVQYLQFATGEISEVLHLELPRIPGDFNVTPDEHLFPG